MTTDDLMKTITKFQTANGRGPSSFEELQEALVCELNTAISDVDLSEELKMAIEAGFIGKDDCGCFVAF